MHEFMIAATFLAMVLSPCAVTLFHRDETEEF